jgi:hypothetical protein
LRAIHTTFRVPLSAAFSPCTVIRRRRLTPPSTRASSRRRAEKNTITIAVEDKDVTLNVDKEVRLLGGRDFKNERKAA